MAVALWLCDYSAAPLCLLCGCSVAALFGCSLWLLSVAALRGSLLWGCSVAALWLLCGSLWLLCGSLWLLCGTYVAASECGANRAPRIPRARCAVLGPLDNYLYIEIHQEQSKYKYLYLEIHKEKPSEARLILAFRYLKASRSKQTDCMHQ